MRLLGRTSSINVRKVMWTAAEIGLHYDHEDEWATAERPTNDPAFLGLNPNGLVPVWCDDLGAFWESNAICRYLATRHGRTDLLPRSPSRRACVERWMDWSAGDLNAAWRYPFMALVRGDPAYRDVDQIQRGIAAWNHHMQILAQHLVHNGPFAAGAPFTLADIVLGLSVHRWRLTPIERPRLDALEAYLGRLAERPAFVALTPATLP